jgi:diadenosine tetraphosphate (Ap4A) HIT family hydrolase
MIKSDTNPYFVCELDTGYVVIGDHQHFHGYTLFLYKAHITELHYMPKAIRQKHLEEMALVSEAVFYAFEPEKMNCELLGNGDAHVHWHLFPRRSGDTPQKGPVWLLPMEEMYSDSKRPDLIELDKMKQGLKREIECLLGAV